MIDENQSSGGLVADPEGENPVAELGLEDESDLSEIVISDTDEEPKVTIRKELPPVEAFADLTLNEKLAKAIVGLGWTKPTPVQSLCLPNSVSGRDVAGFAQTGTGKTGVFLITIAQKLLSSPKPANAGNEGLISPRALVLAPTRELAMQIEDDAKGLFEACGITSMAVFGGIDYAKQAKQLRDGIDVVVATPGRLKDYFQQKQFTLKTCEVFVCDEADRMFDMGFIEDVEYFLDKLPVSVQKLLFSATTNEKVKELAFEYLEHPVYISVNPEVITPERIEQHAIITGSAEKLKILIGLLREHKPTCSIVFTNTKIVAEWLAFKLNGNGIEADIITGDLPQGKRIQLIRRIKEGKVKALIATDVASRGLHIAGVTHVYNFDLPDEAANYVHRIGRTARAGAKGFSYSLVCEDYGQNLEPINQLLGPALALKAEWANPEYQSIQDAAGNPFEGRERGGRFQDKGARSSSQGGHRNERGGQRPQQGRHQGQGGQQRQHGGGGGGKGGPRHGNNKPRHQDNRSNQNRHHDKQHHSRHDHKKPHTTHAPAAAAMKKTPDTQPQTLGQIFKRIVSLVFGKK